MVTPLNKALIRLVSTDYNKVKIALSNLARFVNFEVLQVECFRTKCNYDIFTYINNSIIIC